MEHVGQHSSGDTWCTSWRSVCTLKIRPALKLLTTSSFKGICMTCAAVLLQALATATALLLLLMPKAPPTLQWIVL